MTSEAETLANGEQVKRQAFNSALDGVSFWFHTAFALLQRRFLCISNGYEATWVAEPHSIVINDDDNNDDNNKQNIINRRC